MKKITFILLLCAFGIWSNPLSATIRVAGFWPDQAVSRDVSTGVLMNTQPISGYTTNMPFGGAGSRITVAIEHSGYGGSLSGYEVFMGIEILNATTGAVVSSLPMRYPSTSPHANVVISHAYTGTGPLGGAYANVTMDIPTALVSGTAYKVRVFLNVPGPAYDSSTSTSSATFYNNFAVTTSLGPDINASSYDASTMPTLFFLGGNTVYLTDYIWFEWYIGTTRICSGYQPYDNSNFVTVPPITATSATGWTYLSSYPTIQAGLTNITNDMTIRLNVWAGSNISTFKIQFGDEIVINIPSPAPSKPPVKGSLLDPASNNLDIYPNPVHNEFAVKLNASSNADKVEVYNMMGQLVSAAPISEGQTSVNIQAAEWTKGMYFVKVYAKDELVGSEKILKAE